MADLPRDDLIDTAAARLCTVQPGERITFGDHTGTCRVRSVRTAGGETTIRAWWRRKRSAPADTRVWRWTRAELMGDDGE